MTTRLEAPVRALLVALFVLLAGCEIEELRFTRIADLTFTEGALIRLVLPPASGGRAPLTYSLVPDVPGLHFTAAARALSGTPTAAGTYAMTYTVKDRDNTAKLEFNIIVVDRQKPENTGPSFSNRMIENQTYTAGSTIPPLVLPEAAGDNRPFAYTLVPTVPGLQFAAVSRTLSGTPSAPGIHSMTYRVVDSDGDSSTLTFAILVTEPGYEYMPPSFGTQRVGDQTLVQGIAVNQITLPAANGGSGRLTYRLNPEIPGLTFDADTRVLSGTPTETGRYPMTYTVADAKGTVASLNFAIAVVRGLSFTIPAVSLSFTRDHTIDRVTLPPAVGGTGTFAYSLTPEVPGLSFDPTTRVLSGTPTTTGVYAVTYSATDAAQIASLDFNITVVGFGRATLADLSYTQFQTIETVTLPSASPDTSMFSYRLKPDVPGLMFNSSTRRVSGRPTKPGTYSMTYAATYVKGAVASLSFTIIVRSSPEANLLESEMMFRIGQMDSVVTDAILAHDEAHTSSTESIETYYDAVILLPVVAHLGGILSFPKPDDASYWIGSTGYGNRHLPHMRGYKNPEFINDNLIDLAVKFHRLMGLDDSSHESSIRDVHNSFEMIVEPDATIKLLPTLLPLNFEHDQLVRVRNWFVQSCQAWDRLVMEVKAIGPILTSRTPVCNLTR